MGIDTVLGPDIRCRDVPGGRLITRARIERIARRAGAAREWDWTPGRRGPVNRSDDLNARQCSPLLPMRRSKMEDSRIIIRGKGCMTESTCDLPLI